MTELGNIAMGEIIFSTGCRPVVVYRLTVGAFVGKKPGFDPHKVTKEDCVIDEEHEGEKIYRRLNPNLPPKHLACKHQLEQKTAKCPVDCEERCDPEGFNIFVDWDKVHGTKGSSYLHLAKPIKDVMDLYDIAKSKFFKGRKSAANNKEDWLENDNTPFFLNSSGSAFTSVELKHVSEAMNIDVTAYAFRRIVSTWALSHETEEIRNAEEEALQHGLKVAKDKYLQNKQLKPQVLVQKYIEEEQLLPESVREEIKKQEVRAKSSILETEEKRQKRQHENLVQKKRATKQLQSENRPLGPRHRILGVHRNQFKEIMEEITGEITEDTLKEWKPTKWRNNIVRTVCESDGERGENLRNLWVKIYKGDLKWGVRDERLRAKEKGWPRKAGNAYLQN